MINFGLDDTLGPDEKTINRNCQYGEQQQHRLARHAFPDISIVRRE